MPALSTSRERTSARMIWWQMTTSSLDRSPACRVVRLAPAGEEAAGSAARGRGGPRRRRVGRVRELEYVGVRPDEQGRVLQGGTRHVRRATLVGGGGKRRLRHRGDH